MMSAMHSGPDPAVLARDIIDANQYLTLATADETGTPWASPVWFAHEDHRHFVWVSRPGARHSLNIAARPTIGGVIFDSTVRAGEGQAVYVEAVAAEVLGAERDQAIAVFAQRSRALGLREWHLADVTDPAPHRIYRASASAVFILDPSDQRQPVHP